MTCLALSRRTEYCGDRLPRVPLAINAVDNSSAHQRLECGWAALEDWRVHQLIGATTVAARSAPRKTLFTFA